jgi:hypothetical protein
MNIKETIKKLIYRDTKSYKELEFEIKELQNEIKRIEEVNLLKLELKEQEINNLKELLRHKESQYTKEVINSSNTSSESLENIKLTKTEKIIIKNFHNYQVKDYEELEKVTNKSKEHLRNIVSKLKKKGYTLEWYI